MGDIVVVEATQNVNNCVGIADIRKELITKTFALRCTLYQTCNIDNLDSGGDNTLWVVNLRQLDESLVRYGDNADIRLDSTEREVCRLRLCVRQTVEKSRFTYIW